MRGICIGLYRNVSVMELDWDSARVFLAVVRNGSLRSAGRELGLSQPTVGRRLAVFEAAVSMEPLFDRLPEGLRLTSAGAGIVPLAERLEAAAVALQRRRAVSSEIGGLVRISVGEWAAGFLASCLADVRWQRLLSDKISLEFVESDQTANLSRRAADLAVRHAVPETGELYVSRVGTIACAVYRSVSHKTAGTLPWIAYTEDQSHYASARWVAQRVEATGGCIAIRASSMAIQLSAVRAGAGMAVLPCYVGDTEQGLVRVTDPIAELDAVHWLIVHRDLRRVPRIRAAMDWIRDLFSSQKSRLAGR
jgi:DNA-binding transcriptional LysR family regulator